MPPAQLYGLVLAGGLSRRMGQDKGAIVYPMLSLLNQRERCFSILSAFCDQTFQSCRADQLHLFNDPKIAIVDELPDRGPAMGILSAHRLYPQAAWLVMACDFPHADENTIRFLVEQRSLEKAATVFVHEDGTLEPLLSIWEPPALRELALRFVAGDRSPRHALEAVSSRFGCERLRPPLPAWLLNANSKQDFLANLWT